MKKFIAIAVLAAAAASVALAGEDKSFPDADNNGTLSLAEIRAVKPDIKPETFAMVDSDSNGELTQAEFDAWKAARDVDKAPAPLKSNE